MKKLIGIAILLLVGIGIVNATPVPPVAWSSTYTGINGLDDSATAGVIDSSGNINVVGVEMIQSFPILKTCGWVGQIYSTGTWAWTQRIATTSVLSDCRGVTVDDNNNIYVVGQDAGVAYLNKYDNTGLLQWTTSYTRTPTGSTVWNGITKYADNIYTAGYACDVSTQFIVTFAKYDTDGNNVWVSTYYPSSASSRPHRTGQSIVVRGEHMYIGGNNEEYETIWDYSSSSGSLIGIQQFGGAGRNTDMCFGICLDTGAGIYLAGYIESLHPQKQQIHIKKLGSDLLSRWTYTYPSNAYLGYGGVDRAKGVVAIDTAVYSAGVLYDTTTVQDIWMGKFDTNGSLEWAATYNQYYSTDVNKGGVDYANFVLAQSSYIVIGGAVSFSTTSCYGVNVDTHTIPRGTDGWVTKYWPW